MHHVFNSDFQVETILKQKKQVMGLVLHYPILRSFATFLVFQIAEQEHP